MEDDPGEVGQLIPAMMARTRPEVKVRGHSEVKFRGQSEVGLSVQPLARVSSLMPESGVGLWPGLESV